VSNFATNGPNKASGQVGRKIARYKKNRRAIYASTPAKPAYTVPTLVGTGSGPGSGSGAGVVLTVNFDMQVSLNTGQFGSAVNWRDASQTPELTVVSAVQTSPTQIALTFNGTIQPGDIFVIPDDGMAIRTWGGGFVQPGNYVAP
jgi:hypothetical protein